VLSITKAAEELAVTPAAVSKQIHTLEAFLGSTLFNRVPRGLELTAAGARYLSEIGPAFSALRDATHAVTGGARRRQVLKIRSPATFAVRWLIPRLAGFHRSNPAIDVQLATSPAPLNFDREDLDGGVQLGDGYWPRTSTMRLVPNVLVPVLSPARLHALGKPPNARRLERETLLHSMARPDDWSLWLKAARVSTVDAYRGMRYETSLLSYQAAIEGHGIAVAQKALVGKELESGTLVAPFPLELDRGDVTYYFVTPQGRPASHALQSFIEWLAELVEV